MPEEPRNDYPPAPGQPWPTAFERVMDRLAPLAFVAALTDRVRVGVALLNVPFYAPAVLAKQLATIDVLSEGRLDVGVGLGWSKDEYEAVGVPFQRRGARMDEFLACLKEIWTSEVATFDGEFYRLPAARVEPRPVQQPHPSLLVGGYGPAAIRRALAYGDGFVGGNVPLADVAPLVRALRDGAEEGGRDAASLRVVSRGVVRLHEQAQGPARRPLWGCLEEIREDVDRYREAGLTELFLDLNFDPAVHHAASATEGLKLALRVIEGCARA